uniref:Uncharacterized protein n=1 Tax=Arion vulgaris TaxID=1028688 RepID=A0A0B7AJQ2_9EUPU
MVRDTDNKESKHSRKKLVGGVIFGAMTKPEFIAGKNGNEELLNMCTLDEIHT